jgi:hypothetical protein
MDRYTPAEKTKKLLLIPEEQARPFREQPNSSDPIERLEKTRNVQLCSYSLTYGVIPIELRDVYPLSQTEVSVPPTPLATTLTRRRVAEFIRKFGFSSCLVIGQATWQEQMAARLKQNLKGKVRIRFLEEPELDKDAIRRIQRTLN